MSDKTLTYEQKVKGYMKVFYILVGLTVVELIFVELPKFVPGIPHMLMVILICVASLAKAVYVAVYFMHLNHETAWLRRLVLLSMIGFFFAAVLIPDTIFDRKMTMYIPEPPRVFETKAHDEAKAVPNASPEAAATPDAPAGDTSQAPTDSQGTSEWE